ncbi:MAG: 50S ribosome-binding GTPase [Acidobacteria bacterium]|nr:50S ribosome-binding GTPase [Acidobacteriota bacterium]
MPANLTPQYLAAEERFKSATTAQEKVEALREMLATIPKHKGTEKLQADLKRRLARLNAEMGRKHGVSKASAIYTVRREGAAQVALVGAPNVGKSSLLARLTHATPEIGDYPFTTRLPQPGMMPFEDIQIQLVDLPPVAQEFYEPWMGNIVRSADLALLVVDLGSDDLLDEVEDVLRILEGSRIRLVGDAVEEPSAEEPGAASRGTLLIANKADRDPAEINLRILREFYEPRFTIHPVSSSDGSGLEALPRILFDRLALVRVYTKAPGKKVDLSTPPYVLRGGCTVLDIARAVHREFEHSLKFARVWSSHRSRRSVRFDGQMVERHHRLEDGDVVELHV